MEAPSVKLPDPRGQPQLRGSAAPPGLDCPRFLQMMAEVEGSGSGRRGSGSAELGQAGPPRGAGVSAGGLLVGAGDVLPVASSQGPALSTWLPSPHPPSLSGVDKGAEGLRRHPLSFPHEKRHGGLGYT